MTSTISASSSLGSPVSTLVGAVTDSGALVGAVSPELPSLDDDVSGDVAEHAPTTNEVIAAHAVRIEIPTPASVPEALAHVRAHGASTNPSLMPW
jgi:hypothetical protein